MTRRLLVSIVVLLTTSWMAHAQNPVFSSKVEAVRVDVLVTAGGKPLRGLGPGDFEVFDNGVRQQVDLVSFEALPLNVVLALDVSDSITGERLLHLRSAGHVLLTALKPNDQAALVTFSRAVTLDAGLSRDTPRLHGVLNAITPGGDTSLIDGSYAAMTIGESDVGRSLVIVFSDGVDTSSWLSADAVLNIAKRCNAIVYAVSVGGTPKADFLGDLTDQTGGRRFKADSTKDIGDVFLQMLDEFRQRYVVSYSPQGVAPDGWHKLTVRVRNQMVDVKARPGYFAGK